MKERYDAIVVGARCAGSSLAISLAKRDWDVLLEPILDGFWHLQDEILITDGEPELISTLFNTDAVFSMGG